MSDHESSNAVRLSARQWLVTGAVVLAALCLAPAAWQRLDDFTPDADYRLPYHLAEDYWHYGRWCARAASHGKTLLMGDSVIWGQYVARDQTLSHHLNRRVGEDLFANLGLDGAHPVALAGLLRHHARAIRGQSVILHCNLLWLSSAKRDLQTRKEMRFNHPRLAPQLSRAIPCYREGLEPRLRIVVERSVGFLGWARHLRLACLGGMSLPAWTLDHPYASPLPWSPAAMGWGTTGSAQRGAAVLHRQPGPSRKAPDPRPWQDRGLGRQRFSWVALDRSIQWRFFKRLLATLQRRGNRVFVLVGPLNEHMLDAGSRETFRALRQSVGAWLAENRVPHCLPSVLPSRLYADASHPLADGYRLLAEEILAATALRQ